MLENHLIQRFRDQTNSENRLLRRVQKLHPPFLVFLELAGNAADYIAAHAGQLFPGSIAIGELGAAIAGARVPAIGDAKVIQRHDTKPRQALKNHKMNAV